MVNLPNQETYLKLLKKAFMVNWELKLQIETNHNKSYEFQLENGPKSKACMNYA